MLANAALDLPIIAAAHPLDVGLRRYAALYQPTGNRYPSYFDQVLALCPREALAARCRWRKLPAEMIAAPTPDA